MGVGTTLEGLVTVSARPAKILVTGNMGYVGPSVVARLRESYPDASLIGLDAGYFAHCLTGCSAMPERRLDYQYFGDVRAVPPSVLEGTDAVVHLAAISNDPIGNAYDEVTLEINHEATVRLASEAKAADPLLRLRGKLQHLRSQQRCRRNRRLTSAAAQPIRRIEVACRDGPPGVGE